MRRGLISALGAIVVALCISLVPGNGAHLPSQGGAPEAPQVKTVRVKGASLAYMEQGRGEPVVLIHGFLHDYRVWSAQMEELSKRYRVIAYSRRYHWPNKLTGDGSDVSLLTDEADLVALIKALKLGRVHLIGHSGGVNLALRVARDHPGLVRSLVLGEGGGRALLAQNREAKPLFPPAMVDEVRQAYERGDKEAALRIVVEVIVGDKGWDERRPPFIQGMAMDNIWQLEQLWARRSPVPPLTCEDLQRIKTPALLIRGERTLEVFRLATQELQKCLPGSQLAILPDATHALELENPTGFNEIVLEFLTRHSSRARRR